MRTSVFVLVLVILIVGGFAGCIHNFLLDDDDPGDPVLAAIELANGTQPDEYPTDPVNIKSAIIADDVLTIAVSYGGGCEKHEFRLIANNYFMESNPVQAGTLLSHNGNGDACEALISESLEFSLKPLKSEYLRLYPGTEGIIVLHLTNAGNTQDDKTIIYRF